MQTWIPPITEPVSKELEFDMTQIYDSEYHFLTIIRDLVGLVEIGKYNAPLISEYRKTSQVSFYVQEPIIPGTPVSLLLPKYFVEANVKYYADNAPYINTAWLFTYEVWNVYYRQAANALIVTYGIRVQQLPSRPYDPNYTLNAACYVNLAASYATCNNLGKRKEIHYTSNHDGIIALYDDTTPKGRIQNDFLTTPRERMKDGSPKLTTITKQKTSFNRREPSKLSLLQLFRKKRNKEGRK